MVFCSFSALPAQRVLKHPAANAANPDGRPVRSHHHTLLPRFPRRPHSHAPPCSPCSLARGGTHSSLLLVFIPAIPKVPPASESAQLSRITRRVTLFPASRSLAGRRKVHQTLHCAGQYDATAFCAFHDIFTSAVFAVDRRSFGRQTIATWCSPAIVDYAPSGPF